MTDITTKTVRVPAINCGHCVNTVQREVGALTGVESVTASSDDKRVTVTWSAATTWETIKQTLVEIGYAPEE